MTGKTTIIAIPFLKFGLNCIKAFGHSFSFLMESLTFSLIRSSFYGNKAF